MVSVTTNQAKLCNMFTKVCPPIIALGDKEIDELFWSELCFWEYPIQNVPSQRSRGICIGQYALVQECHLCLCSKERTIESGLFYLHT
jgi:hypothetical protein